MDKDATKEEDITTKSDDLSSLSVLPIDEEESERIKKALAEADKGGEGEDDSKDDTADLEDTVIRVDQNQPPLGEEPFTEGAVSAVSGTVIIKDYVEQHQEPDKQITPPKDATGHINMIQAHAMGQIINSEKKEVNPQPEVNPLLKLFPLMSAAPEVPDPDTAQKIAQESQID